MSVPLPPPFGPDLKVLVLAGTNPVSERKELSRAKRRARGELEVPLAHKAFLPLRGRLVIDHVLDALAESGLRRIWVLAEEHALRRLPAIHRVTRLPQPPAATLFANLSRAYAALEPGPDEPVLVVFGDHPLTTPAAIHRFLIQSAALLGSADFVHAFALRSAYHAYAPWFCRTSVHLRQFSGRATGLSLAVPSRLHRFQVFDQMYAVRKQERVGAFLELLLRIVQWLGWRSLQALLDAGVLWLAKECEKLDRRGGSVGAFGHWASRRLSRWVPASRVEGYVARVLKAERGVRLAPIAHGALALDVDFAEELEALELHWSELQRRARTQDASLQQPQGVRTSMLLR